MNYNGIVCSYIRLSDEDCKKEKNYFSKSVLNQLNFIEEYAKKNGLSINKNFIDDGYTGINFNRPAFSELINDIKNKKVSVIITKDFSRLGRVYNETAYYITKFFPENNIRYIAINENYDSVNSDSIINDIKIGFKSIINDRFVKENSNKIKEVKKIKTEQGFYMGYTAPYGYEKNYQNNKISLKIDKQSAIIVKKIFEEISKGFSRKQVAKMLNQDNIKTPMQYKKMTKSKGKNYLDKWSDNIIYRIVRNNVYTGDNIIRKTTKSDYKQNKRKCVSIRDRQLVKNTHPAIVSEELYKKANDNIKTLNRKEKWCKRYNGLLNGKVVCGCCKNEMEFCR